MRSREAHTPGKMKNALRLVPIFGGIVLFSFLVAFSAFKVRYQVQGAQKNEFNVIEYTLTDSIKRGKGRNFTLTSVSTSKGEPGKIQPKPCPT